MAFEGRRKTLPSSRWANVIDLLEETHWTYDELLEAPRELADEWLIRIHARRAVEYKQAKRQEAEAKSARR